MSKAIERVLLLLLFFGQTDKDDDGDKVRVVGLGTSAGEGVRGPVGALRSRRRLWHVPLE